MKSILLLSAVLLIACSTEDADNTGKKTAGTQLSAEHKKVVYHNDYQISSYTSTPWGFSSNSYWIEGPDGVVLIDTQFLPSAANEVVDIAESVTGKKVVLAIVLHASPDRFNGVATLKSRGIRVVSSQQIVEQIPEEDKKQRSWFYQRYQPDYPQQLVLPDVAWNKTQEFAAAGLHFKAYVIRDALSKAHLLIELDKHLFTGALVSNKAHAWMELGKSAQWLERLEEIRRFTQHKVIHPGRGYAMAGEALLQQQENYLRFVRKAVADIYTGGEISAQDKKDIIKKITEKYADYAFAYFLNTGVPAEWEQMRKKDHEML